MYTYTDGTIVHETGTDLQSTPAPAWRSPENTATCGACVLAQRLVDTSTAAVASGAMSTNRQPCAARCFVSCEFDDFYAARDTSAAAKRLLGGQCMGSSNIYCCYPCAGPVAFG